MQVLERGCRAEDRKRKRMLLSLPKFNVVEGARVFSFKKQIFERVSNVKW